MSEPPLYDLGGDEDLLRELDEKLGGEAAAEELRFLATARRRAEETGETVDAILQADLAAMRASTYPGPDCLDPDQVERYAANQPTDDETAHVEQCPACRRLVEAARLSPERVEKAMLEIRQALGEREASLESAEETPTISITQGWSTGHAPGGGTPGSRSLALLRYAGTAIGGAVAAAIFLMVASNRESTMFQNVTSVLPSPRASETSADDRELPISPDGRMIVSYKVGDDSLRREPRGNHHTDGRQFKFFVLSDDQNQLAAASKDEDEVVLWDLSTWSQRSFPADGLGGVRALEFSDDGRRLTASFGDGLRKMWDIPSAETGDEGVMHHTEAAESEPAIAAPE